MRANKLKSGHIVNRETVALLRILRRRRIRHANDVISLAIGIDCRAWDRVAGVAEDRRALRLLRQRVAIILRRVVRVLAVVEL